MSMNSTLYGIANCDSVKGARAWLKEHDRVIAFHDFKKWGVPPDRLDAWLDAIGWEALLNRKGTTWRKLSEPARSSVVDRVSAKALMLEHPSLIRRPVVEWPDGSISAGFDEERWAARWL